MTYGRLNPALEYHVVNSLGWADLRPLQRAAIGPVLSGDDCLLIAPTAGTDEARNASGDGKLFYSRTLSENPGASGGAFDDRVTWLSPNLVAHRLITAGRLP